MAISAETVTIDRAAADARRPARAQARSERRLAAMLLLPRSASWC